MSSKHISKCEYKFFCCVCWSWGWAVVIIVGMSPWVSCLPSSPENAQSCLTLWDPMDYSLPGSSVHGILQARILEWVAIPFSRGFSNQGSNLCLQHCSIPILATGFFTVSASSPTMLCWKLVSMKQELLNIFPSQWGQHTASNWLRFLKNGCFPCVKMGWGWDTVHGSKFQSRL